MRPPGWAAMRGFIAKVAIGPEASRDLTEAEAHEAMRLCLDRSASDVQIAVLLVAERLKRETEAENLGFLRALVDASNLGAAPCDEVANLGDPYDGFDRGPHFAPVVAAVLGACGLPAVVHGAVHMPPKDGVTHRRVLEALGRRLDVGRGADSVKAAALRAAEHGAAYVDLEDGCPALHALTSLREEIAKRPALSTLEKLVAPIRGRAATHVVSSYVHAGYDTLMASLCHRIGFATSLIVKGREGHLDCHAHRVTAAFGHTLGRAAAPVAIPPLDGAAEPSFEPATPENVGAMWMEALSGRDGWPGQVTVATAAAILRQAGRDDALRRAREALVSGRARGVFDEI